MNTLKLAIEPDLSSSNDIPEPWYRQGWPWFLISIPLTSVLLGFLMLYLGLSTNNSLVVDDYYKQGKGINLRIQRDKTASLLGLSARVSKIDASLVLDLKLAQQLVPEALLAEARSLRESFQYPTALKLAFVHVTQASKDFEVLFENFGGARYIAPLATMPAEGRWRMHLEPVGEPIDTLPGSSHGLGSRRTGASNKVASEQSGIDWRLVGSPTTSGALTEVLLIASEPKDVFTPQMLKQ